MSPDDSKKPQKKTKKTRVSGPRSDAAPRQDPPPVLVEGADSLVGTVIDKYEVLSLIGEGGMGGVYKARHREINRIVALKVLLEHLLSEKNAGERFKQEAKAAGSLDHPNLCPVHDYGFSNGKPYLVMDFIDGESLEDLMLKAGRLPMERFFEIFNQVCKGLKYAHDMGIIHRDLKPSNIMLARDEDGNYFVKIVDFGIAKLLPQGDESGAKLTRTGHVFGSPLYMSPEQCLGKKLDPRSDIYSIGCLMYETLSGIAPFDAESTVASLVKHVNEDAVPFSAAAKDVPIPEDVEQMVFKCLSKNPEDRYSSVQELRDELKRLRQVHLGEAAERAVRPKPPLSSAVTMDETSVLTTSTGRAPAQKSRKISEPTSNLPTVEASEAEKFMSFVSDVAGFLTTLKPRTAAVLGLTILWALPFVPWLFGAYTLYFYGIFEVNVWQTPLKTFYNNDNIIVRMGVFLLIVFFGFMTFFSLFYKRSEKK